MTNPVAFSPPQMDLSGFSFGTAPQVKVADFIWPEHPEDGLRQGLVKFCCLLMMVAEVIL